MRYSLFIGRFQPLHANHVALIRSLLAEAKKVVVGLMDTARSPQNPYSVDERKQMLRQAFGNAIEIVVIPHIAEVCYGRALGYKFRELSLDPELPEISGTKVREVICEPDLNRDAMFIQTFGEVAKVQHENMVKQGFWPDGDRNDGEAIALIMSEAVEVLEALRSGNPPDKDLPSYSAAEVQLADAVGRIMDLAEGRGWRIAEALIDKIQFNKTREYRHGKEF